MMVWWLRLRQWTSTVVLAAAYFGVLTPVALGSRLLRDDPLARRFDPDADSYLEPCEATVPESLLGLLWARGKWWLVPMLLVVLLSGVLVAASELSLSLAFLYPLF